MPPPVPLLEPPPAGVPRPKKDRAWNLSPAQPAGTFAIVSCVKSLSILTDVEQTAVVRVLLPSLNRTVTPAERAAWSVRLYLCADDTDDFFKTRAAQVAAAGVRFGIDVRLPAGCKEPALPSTAQSCCDILLSKAQCQANRRRTGTPLGR